MDQTHQKNRSTQQSWTAVETNSFGHPILSEKNILELIYEDKWNNVKDCLIQDGDYVKQYNNSVSENKDKFNLLDATDFDVDRDNYDQQNRSNWFIPEEYKTMDIEKYILDLCKTPQEIERVNYELDLYKSHAMMDVLKFLKYMVDRLRKNKIIWGVGRGSSVASYILYLMGVHKVNSIQYDLDPTEFLR
jgi:DNA polymerase III alpha subunit